MLPTLGRHMHRAIIIAGPTGVGKTDLALRLAQLLGGELISCDSVQVYKHLEIGANKDRSSGVPQHLLDFVELDAPFTAADFYDRCFEQLEQVVARDRVPILVGGTGFYLDWLVKGRPSAPATDAEVMQQVDRDVDALAGWSQKLALLSAGDSEYAATLSVNDTYRLKRALAVFRQTGRPLSSFTKKAPATYDWRCFYLTADREALNRSIDARCERMVQRGLVQETKALVDAGLLRKDSSPGRAIGYHETIAFLEAAADGTDLVPKFRAYLGAFKAATRQYSRRQETWFRRMHDFKWIERPSLQAPLDSALIDRVACWYRLERGPFEDALGDTDAATRERIVGDSRANTKRMKMYCSKADFFDSDETIKAFLHGCLK